jgi:hypothetical protein
MTYSNIDHRYHCWKPFGNEKLVAGSLRYPNNGLLKKSVQLASQEIRTSNAYSDAVGDTGRARVIWIS